MTLAAWLFSPTWDDDAASGPRRSFSRDPGQVPASDLKDEAVLARLRLGDSTALSEVYHALYADLLRFAWIVVHSRPLAEEAVQDVFAALWARRETVMVQGSLRGYLFTAVRYRALNARRAQRTASRLELHVGPEVLPEPLAGPDAELLSAEESAAVRAAVATLSARQREAVTLRMQSQLTYEEIGTVLGVSADAARMLVNRALSELRTLLAGYVRG